MKNNGTPRLLHCQYDFIVMSSHLCNLRKSPVYATGHTAWMWQICETLGWWGYISVWLCLKWRKQNKVGIDVYPLNNFKTIEYLPIHIRVCMIILLLLVVVIPLLLLLMKRTTNIIGHLLNTSKGQSWYFNLEHIWLYCFLTSAFPRCTILSYIRKKKNNQKLFKTCF